MGVTIQRVMCPFTEGMVVTRVQPKPMPSPFHACRRYKPGMRQKSPKHRPATGQVWYWPEMDLLGEVTGVSRHYDTVWIDHAPVSISPNSPTYQYAKTYTAQGRDHVDFLENFVYVGLLDNP